MHNRKTLKKFLKKVKKDFKDAQAIVEWDKKVLLYMVGLNTAPQLPAGMERLSKKLSARVNEYALKPADGTEGTDILCAEEGEVYRHLRLQWIPPELREDWGEIEAALERKLPRLVERSDLEGDLQMHTTASDGHQSVA